MSSPKDEIALFAEHRRECVICGNSNPLCGPHCVTGRQLRNNGIDECAASIVQETWES